VNAVKSEGFATVYQCRHRKKPCIDCLACCYGKFSLELFPNSLDNSRMVKRSPDRETPAELIAEGSAEAELLLQRAGDLLEPLAQLLVKRGVGYTQLAQALKPVFLEAARKELKFSGRKETDAALSLLSGLHRKDVRAFEEQIMAAARASKKGAQHQSGATGRRLTLPRSLSFAEQVFTRWATDAAYLNRDGKPAVLPVLGPEPSFDALVNSISKDFSRRTVLDELLRLGLVQEEGEQLVPLTNGVAPTRGFDELTRYLSTNVQDHLAAAVQNVLSVSDGEKAPFLEHAMYANGLSEESIALLSNLARQLWQGSFKQMVDTARQRHQIDEAKELPGRMRFGVYFYSENSE
jgi:hypothetical protein